VLVHGDVVVGFCVVVVALIIIIIFVVVVVVEVQVADGERRNGVLIVRVSRVVIGVVQ